MKNRVKKRTFIFEKLQNLTSRVKSQRFRKANMWKYDEMVRYTLFINDYLQKHSENQISKADFSHMAEHVKTRNTNQCRIFHLRMLKVCSDLPDLLNFFRTNIQFYETYYQQYKQSMTLLESSIEVPGSDYRIQEHNQEENELDSSLYRGILEDFHEEDFVAYKLPPCPLDIFQRSEWSGSHKSWLEDI